MSVITTIEKLFHIKSASIALLLNFSEIGQICTSLLLTYYAGRGHRPRWIACGMFLFSLAAFGSVSPHFLFGSRLYSSRSAVAAKMEMPHGENHSEFLISNLTGSLKDESMSLCIAEDVFRNLSNIDPSEFAKKIICISEFDRKFHSQHATRTKEVRTPTTN